MAETVGVRLHDELIHKLDELSEDEQTERSVILRKVIEKGINQWKLEKALALYRDGKVTLWKAAEIADTPLWEMLEILETKKIPYNYDIDEVARYVRDKYGKVV